MKQEMFAFKKRLKSFSFARNGILQLFRSEHNAKVHLVVGLVTIVLGILLSISRIEWISLVIIIGLVFSAELFNTAIERLADKVEPKWCEGIGLVKDFAAGAVLIVALIAIVVGGLIFLPKIMIFI